MQEIINCSWPTNCNCCNWAKISSIIVSSFFLFGCASPQFSQLMCRSEWTKHAYLVRSIRAQSEIRWGHRGYNYSISIRRGEEPTEFKVLVKYDLPVDIHKRSNMYCDMQSAMHSVWMNTALFYDLNFRRLHISNHVELWGEECPGIQDLAKSLLFDSASDKIVVAHHTKQKGRTVRKNPIVWPRVVERAYRWTRSIRD